MSQHPLAPQRFKRPRNWLAPSQLVHDLDDRQHCRTCQRCKIDREEREQEKAKRVKAEAEADKKFHQGLDPNHREKCDLCRTIYDRHAFHKLKEAHNKGIEASHEANSAWIAPHEVGLRTYRSFRVPNPPSSVLFLLPGRELPISPTRSPSPEAVAKVSRLAPRRKSGRKRKPRVWPPVAGDTSKQSSKKRSIGDSDQTGSGAIAPPSVRRRTTPNLLPLGTRTGEGSQQARKRGHSDLVQDDVEFAQADIPTIPGQFSPGRPLFIRDPAVAVAASHPPQGDDNTSPAMSVFGALSNLAGKAIWTAASTIGRQIGYTPTNNAGQQVVSDEARQSPKRRRTDDTPAPALVDTRIGVDPDEDMRLSSPTNNGVAKNGDKPFTHSYSSINARTHLSSSASNAARRALFRYPPRAILEPRRRIPQARTMDPPELSTDDSLGPTQEQAMPGSWVSEPDEQSSTQSSDLSTTATSPSTQEKHSGSYNKSTVKPDPYLLSTRSPPRSDAFYTLSRTRGRGPWARNSQSNQSSTEVSDQTSSTPSTHSEQPEENSVHNEETSTADRSDPEPKFKTRADFFEHDENLLVPGLEKLGLNELKNQELKSQREERQRLEREKRIAAEKAKEEARLRAEAEKWNAQLRGLGLRKPKRKWITDLSEEWEQKVDDSMTRSNVTCAPPEAVTMTPRDFNRMIPDGQWLNDSCVQAALTELATAVNKSAGRVLKQDTPKCVALGTFFWTTLRDKGPENKERMMKRTWGMTPLNFLDIDTIIMPINESSHWTFILIRPKRREVAYVDSFGGNGSQKVVKALRFIEVFLGPARWEPKEWRVLTDLHVPSQHNSWDCGMFVITNSIYIALGLDPNTYSEAELPLQRRRIAAVLLNGGFKGDFNLEDL